MRPSSYSSRMAIMIELAGVSIRIALRLPNTKKYFEGYIINDDCEGWDIRVEDRDPERYPLVCPSRRLDPYSEAYLLMARTSAFLLKFQRTLIHGVSLIWHDRAWLITAPSGTGKTTQLRHWQRLWPEEIALINGDKSVLALHEDGTLWLHPSPWTGKEKDAGDACAPLAGIIVLEQAGHNNIRRIPARESVLRIFQQFLVADLTAKELQEAAKLESKLIDTIPIWLLKNLGDEASARLTRDTIMKYEAENHETV